MSKKNSKKTGSSKKTIISSYQSERGIYVLLTAVLLTIIGGYLLVSSTLIPISITRPSSTEKSNKNISASIIEASKSAAIKTSDKPKSPKKEAAALIVNQIPANYGRTTTVPILMYHYIGNNPNPADKARDDLSVSPDKFDEQMGYLASKGYSPISLDELYNVLKGTGGLPAKPVVLTFDDGYIDFYLNAFPILRKYNFHAVSFIPTGLMNQGYYLSWDQIKEMNSSGLIIFEPHTVNHLNLTSLSEDKLAYQVAESKKVLEAELGHPVNFFAYPYGISNSMVWESVKKAGLLGAVGTWGGVVESEGTLYNMPRIKIAGTWSIVDFSSRFK